MLAELSGSERVRAERFVAERDRVRFVAGRGFLRHILSGYLAIEPARIGIEEMAHGKPSVDAPTGSLYFNLSHTGPFAALAVSRNHDIGVDIEQVRPITDGLAERFFSPRECNALDALPEMQRLPAFFRCWTRKEAFVKATGDGLQRGLETFTVDIADVPRTRLLHLDNEPDAPARWTFLNFQLAADVFGSVAVPSADETIALTRQEIARR